MSVFRCPLGRAGRAYVLIAAAGGLASAVAGAQTQLTVGPQVQVDGERGPLPCNETSIAASPSNPLEIAGAWNDYREAEVPRVGVGLSLDGGKTWSDFLLRPPPAYQTVLEGDPMTAADPRTGALWAGGISFGPAGGIFCARKDAGAASFGPTVMINTGGGIDKGWMAAGPDFADPSGATRVYCAYSLGSQVSTDLGLTWSSVVGLGTGLGFLPRVGPNGEYYVVYWNLGTGVKLKRSLDGGASFDPTIHVATRMDVWSPDGSRVPGDYRVGELNGLAVDPRDGALYVVYPDTTDIQPNGSNLDVYFTKSTDLGGTWTTPVVINDDASPIPGDQFFPWVECDEAGRLHLTFLDTRHTLQDDDDSPGWIDVYYAYSDDQGASWTEVRLTAEPWSSGLDGFEDGFIGDYIGLSTAGHRTLPLYLTTHTGDADVFANVIIDGPAATYCFGIACPCGNNDPEAGCGNLGFDASFATGALLEATGSSSLAANDMVVTLSGLKPDAPAILFTGTTPDHAPFGDGLRCVFGAIKRYPLALAGPTGTLVLGPGEIVLGSLALAPGETRYFQGWYRDLGGPCGTGTNFTNAFSVTWLP